ncbi:MAG: mandelate racemase/muconate lactonizing enzyme family protein [Chloroflexota bacterium]
MKITNVEAFPVWGGGRNFFFVAVDTDEGISGIGEAGITGRELASAAVVEHFKPILVGQDPTRIEHLWQVMFRGGFFPAGRIAAGVLSAIDIALWDIRGKALGVPIYELLGGLVRDRVVCYPHNVGHHMEIDSLVESCLRTREEGWKFVRWGLPQDGSVLEPTPSIRASLRQMEAVRKAVGDDVEICFDVHTRLDPADTIQFCRAAEQFRPFFIEDPVRSENQSTLRLVRQQTAVPLAAGEQFGNKWEFRELVENDLIDYARIDLCIVGGITEAKKIAGWCEAHYIKLALHNPLGPISSAACLQLNLATSNFGVQEQPGRTGTVLTDVVPVQPEWRDGYLLPPGRPGLGVEFDRDAARKHPYQQRDLPNLHRLDGSFTNW